MNKLVSLILLAISLTSFYTTTAQNNVEAVRPCQFTPGVSVAVQMPADVINAPTPTPYPTSTPHLLPYVDGPMTQNYLAIYRGIWNAVNDNYVYADFGGHDWQVIGSRYEALIHGILSDHDFYALMGSMIRELGDNHSYFQSPAEVQADAEELAKGKDFVGIGASLIPIAGTEYASFITIFPDSPADQAGILPHDTLMSVDGGAVRQPNGVSRTRGPEGTQVTLTIQRPGEEPHDITLTRQRVTGSLPIDYCMIPDTRIGYIFLPTLLDESIDDQTRAALQNMTADAPLEGLILDNRMNGGGLGSVTQAILGMFAEGLQGYFVSREGQDPLELTAEDIGGSQSVPMVVLVGVNTVSYGEILSGVLRLAGRAVIIGDPTLGNVEQLRAYDFEDGSRAWIASATFEPLGQANGVWEETGIIPDVVVPSRWDLFTEATDPALAKAVEFLLLE